MWETMSVSFKFDFLVNIFPEQESVYRNPIFGEWLLDLGRKTKERMY